jgi:hypothetical protein
MNYTIFKPDTIGALASTLCVVHCVATPFLFIVQTCTATCCDAAPAWWIWLDYIFLTISFWAIYQSTQNTSKKIIIPLLWGLWSLLFLMVVNERLNWIDLSKNMMHIVAITLAGLHIFNLKYCQCQTDQCCTTNE